MPGDDAPRTSSVLVLAPQGRDGALICTVLGRAGIHAAPVADVRALQEGLLTADVVIVAEEALNDSACEAVCASLGCQELWSDLPLIVLALPNSASSGVELFARLSPAANLTLVERPAGPFTLVSVTRAALRARQRQYLMRDHMAELVAAREEIGRRRDELAEARTRLDSTLEAAEIGTWMWDAGSERVVADRNFAGIFGKDPKDPGAATVSSYLRATHPDDRDGLIRKLKASLKRNEPFEAEFRVRHADGSVRWVMVRGRVVRDAEGRPASVPGAVVDVTDRVESDRARRYLMLKLERQTRVFDTTLSATPDLAYVVDQQGRFQYANRALLDLLGLGPEAVLGRTFSEVGYPEETATKLHDQTAFVFDTGEEIRDEGAFTSPAGVWGYYEYIMVPVRAEDGSIEGVVGTTREISQRKMLEDKRSDLLNSERSARAEAERVGRLKDEFLSTLSHELRTPLNAISGWVQLLRRGTLSEQDQAKAIETISRNTQSQKNLIDDLLDMSRIVSGKVRLESQPINLGVVVLDAVESVRPAAEAKDITLTAAVDPLIGETHGDPNRLQQVVWNLVSNAVKFTPKGGAVRVELHRSATELTVCVTDDGIGIAPEFLPQVFDRFRQADASITRRHGGLGLGLSIVKQIVEMHGGSVGVTSPGVGRGATFTVNLPASPAIVRPPEDARRPRAKRETTPPPTDALKGTTVLIVDDDPDGREILQRMLEDTGTKVLTADSVDAADGILADTRVDVLLSDIGMPDRDGYDLIRSLRASPKPSLQRLPAAALTAFARPEDRQAALRAGYDAHISKPVEPGVLIAVVESLAGKSNGQSCVSG